MAKLGRDKLVQQALFWFPKKKLIRKQEKAVQHLFAGQPLSD
jgi:hypothetical protein